MFNWFVSLFCQNKVEVDPIDDEPSILIKMSSVQILDDSVYANIIRKIKTDDKGFTQKDITFMSSLTNSQLVYLILLKLED